MQNDGKGEYVMSKSKQSKPSKPSRKPSATQGIRKPSTTQAQRMLKEQFAGEAATAIAAGELKWLGKLLVQLATKVKNQVSHRGTGPKPKAYGGKIKKRASGGRGKRL